MISASPQSLQNIDVDFQHWRVELDEDVLQFGSPHYEISRARRELFDVCEDRGRLVSPGFRLPFLRPQILLANEVFPEAAVADPLADLEILDEWNTGVRIFPYPGQYSRLGLVAQESKGPSTSSVGVLGEIMAGLFAQVAISPWVIVRVVEHWPDFIFYNPQEGRYSFVESKAFTTKLGNSAGLFGRVLPSLLKECALQAVLQINTDPWVKVWGAFTAIESIKPCSLVVTFVEFDCPSRLQNSAYRRVVPDAVITGIATQAMVFGAQQLQDSDPFTIEYRRPRRVEPDETRRALLQAAYRHVGHLLAKAGPDVAISNSRSRIEAEIARIASSVTFSRDERPRPFYEGRRIAAQGTTAAIRAVGREVILMRELAGQEIDTLEHRWRGRWEDAANVYRMESDQQAWRFGGAVYWFGPPPLAIKPR